MFDKIEVIDNFLTQQDFNELCSINLKNVNNDEKKVYYNKIFKNGKIQTDCIEEKLLKRLHKNYHSVASEILKKYAPEKLKLYEYSDFHIVISGCDHSYPIHNDSRKKLLSGVVYLSPEKNLGTTLYSKDKKVRKDIEWRKNRALFFSRTENTPHSYKSDGISNRVTLIYNLMTTDIKGVAKAENKFYFYFLLKIKLKKYLQRYFNF